MSRHEVATRRVLYEIPGMRSIQPRHETLNGLPLAVYESTGGSAAVVILLEGYPDVGFQQHVGCRFMDMEWTISMAQLIAASGMTAITHANRDPKTDAIALIEHVKAAHGKAGIWATSGHAPVALEAAQHATCGVFSNPVTGDVCPDIPIFVVRSGRDETAGLNTALDAFVARAIAANRPVTLVNYPDAPHAFELFLDTKETRRILRQGLDFLRVHLS